MDRWRRAGAVLLLASAAIVLWLLRPDRSVVYLRRDFGDLFGGDPNVRSGAAFDHGEIDVAGVEELIVPSGAVVSLGDGRSVRVFLKKTVGSAGHPPEMIDPLSARGAMGIATRRSGAALECGTYGEWWNIEGRASVESLHRAGGPEDQHGQRSVRSRQQGGLARGRRRPARMEGSTVLVRVRCPRAVVDGGPTRPDPGRRFDG